MDFLIILCIIFPCIVARSREKSVEDLEPLAFLYIKGVCRPTPPQPTLPTQIPAQPTNPPRTEPPALPTYPTQTEPPTPDPVSYPPSTQPTVQPTHPTQTQPPVQPTNPPRTEPPAQPTYPTQTRPTTPDPLSYPPSTQPTVQPTHPCQTQPPVQPTPTPSTQPLCPTEYLPTLPTDSLKETVVILTKWAPKKGDSPLPSVWWYYPQFGSNARLAITYIINGNPKDLDFNIHSAMGWKNLSPQCEGILEKYQVEIYVNDQSVYSLCLGDKRAQWMHDRKDLLKDFSLAELVIPGTHQSAAYVTEKEVDRVGPPKVSSAILHQDKSIKAQLLDGIRYLDLRPAILETAKRRKYVLMLDDHHTISMDKALEEIKHFIDHSHEIVIVSFRNFSQGFTRKSHHEHFITYLEEKLRSRPYRRTYTIPKLKDFWRKDERLFLSYDHPTYYKESDILWPAIHQYEGNFLNPGDMSSYTGNSGSGIRAIIPHLDYAGETMTSNNLPLREDPRTAANEIFGETFKWCVGAGHSAVNIIGIDYYDATGVVDLAIQLNEIRARGRHSH